MQTDVVPDAFASDSPCRSFLDVIDEGVLVYETLFPHHVRYANLVAERLIGHPAQGLIGRPLGDLLKPARQPHGAGGLLLARLAEKGAATDFQVTTPWRAHPFPLGFAAQRALPDPKCAALVFRDVAEEWRLREELRLAEEVFDYSPEAIMVTDEAGTIMRVNPAFTLITGYRPEEAIGRNPRLLRSDRHDAAFYAALWRGLRENGHWHGEIWDKRKDGEIYPKWLCINAVHAPSGQTRYVAMFSDISERKLHEARIEHLARHDPLTGLSNRIDLLERAGGILPRARRGDLGAALMMIDLDRFKPINDTLGHDVGDHLLIEVAGRLNASVRATDIVARLGGDEFVVLLADAGEQDEIARLAEKIRARLAAPYEIAGHVLHISPSIGIALCPQNGEDMDSLLKAADIAMYRIKNKQRNGWCFFSHEMDEAAQRRQRIEADLRTALAEGQLVLLYQPQFDIAHERVIAWEALLRWQHPEWGQMPPDAFLPVAEESGLIVPIGAWVLETACRDAVAWSGARGSEERVAVNVSLRQLGRSDFVDTVSAALENSGLAPERLELEVTEQALFCPTAQTRENLESLRNLGVRLTLDDFGTGYSSLVGLSCFAVDRLKIDRSFAAGVGKGKNAAIVSAALSLATAFGIEAVAEGVETSEQMAFLIEQGCMRAQGFLYGHPMEASAVSGFRRGA